MRLINLKAITLLLLLPGFVQGQNNLHAIAPTSQPTTADVQTLVNAKEYSTAIKLSTKMLSLRGASATGMSRFEVTMLKGDAQAGMKSISSAVMTYKSAAQETQDPHELALSHWTAELFHTAGSTVYIPKMAVGIPRRGPFNLLNADQRKLGFEALLEDNLSALEPKLKAATVSQSIPQIWPVLQQVVDLSQLDEIANGSDDKTTAIASSLLDHARNLMSNLLKEYWARLGDIDTHANVSTPSQVQQWVNGTLMTQSINQKNGLTEANKSELKDMIATCKKIHDAALQLMKFAKSDQGWNNILSDANRVSGRAGDVLGTDYTGVVSQVGGDPYNTGGYGTGIIGGVQNGGGIGFRANATATTRPAHPKPTTRP